MRRFAAFLRGINVSGQKIIKMDALRGLADGLGYADARTYIQSGNLVFSASKMKPPILSKEIRTAIRSSHGFDAVVIVKTAAELAAIAAANPFPVDRVSGVKKLYVTLLEEKPKKENLAALLEHRNGVDRYVYSTDYLVIYTVYANGYGKSEFSNNFLEKMLGVAATTRNFATVAALLKMFED
jgi:uncharacterized protein (DUF1697 family)